MFNHDSLALAGGAEHQSGARPSTKGKHKLAASLVGGLGLDEAIACITWIRPSIRGTKGWADGRMGWMQLWSKSVKVRLLAL